MKIAFFGTPEIAVTVLKRLKLADIIPDLIISNPDAKVGRKGILTSPPAALYAKENSIDLLQPETLKDEAVTTELTKNDWDVFIVVAYGKILPKWLLDLPNNGVLNVHPSLLPKFRGASPIRSAILNNERNTGVSIMLLDEKMDHGPILAQEKALISADEWPMDGLVLDQILADLGGDLLVTTLTKFLNKEISPKEQNHEEATFCTKITKEMSEVKIDPNNLPIGKEAYQILLKIRAFAGWPETFFIHEGKRIKIKSAVLDNAGRLLLKRIIPEGKKEMDFSVYFS